MTRRAKWAIAIVGALLALAGAAELAVTMVLPRAIAAKEESQGIGLFDPELGYDPILQRPPTRRTFTAIASLAGGLALITFSVLAKADKTAQKKAVGA